MAKRSKRLATLTEVAVWRARAAAGAIARGRAEVEERRARLVQLSGFRTDYQRGLGESQKAGLSSQRLLQQLRFLDRLDRAVADQGEEVARAEQHLDRHRRRWRSLQARSDAVAEVLERQVRAERREEVAREQAEADDRPPPDTVHSRPRER